MSADASLLIESQLKDRLQAGEKSRIGSDICFDIRQDTRTSGGEEFVRRTMG